MSNLTREEDSGIVIPEEKAEGCCDNEANQYERETDSGLCPSCKEHSNEIACLVCGEMVFVSACCG